MFFRQATFYFATGTTTKGLFYKEVLKGYADEFDQQFVEFKKDLKNYYDCLKQRIGVCHQ